MASGVSDGPEIRRVGVPPVKLMASGVSDGPEIQASGGPFAR